MDTVVQFLSDPNVAYILLVVGFIGIITEIFHTGAIIPGAVGAISLIMAMIGLGQLPFSWGGVALLLIAAGFFAAELQIGGIGALGVAGLLAFIAGSVTLYSAGAATLALNPLVIGLMTAILAGTLFFIWRQLQITRRAPLVAGSEMLRNTLATSLSKLNPRGRVRTPNGEVWTAELQGDGNVEPHQAVRILAVKGAILQVEAAEATARTEWETSGWNGKS